ncbi:hypothetical protein M406DRAFT_73936 [Cryphonectria parasitica EP155]|uniref:Uncharacterized protein n=1 Tax=Cryphonectria parasitica (strain ATCC 38755 / EP155) TaxID=660469 RepID=A0A9P4XYM5_CRYP1|nr:uncharacterized protein M406DRAFT_73936 [Cryphonectria parasitica EP155]KAF3763321.1 hypothetical protein M406DRAFT_73936 [Cryphonectria parasitica EP155]
MILKEGLVRIVLKLHALASRCGENLNALLRNTRHNESSNPTTWAGCNPNLFVKKQHSALILLDSDSRTHSSLSEDKATQNLLRAPIAPVATSLVNKRSLLPPARARVVRQPCRDPGTERDEPATGLASFRLSDAGVAEQQQARQIEQDGETHRVSTSVFALRLWSLRPYSFYALVLPQVRAEIGERSARARTPRVASEAVLSAASSQRDVAASDNFESCKSHPITGTAALKVESGAQDGSTHETYQGPPFIR